MTRRELLVLKRRCCFGVLAAASLLTLLFAIAEVRLARLPFQRDYGEGHVLWMSQRILDTHGAYRPLDSLPWVVCPYTPGYLVASRLASTLIKDPLAAGRALSLASTFGIGVTIGLTILFATGVRFPLLWRLAAAAFGGAAPFAAASVLTWASLMRVDMLAWFFMYAGLAVYIVLGKRERWQFAAGALFLLALFTKQTVVGGPLACLLFGFPTCPGKTLRVYASMAVAGLAGVFWLNAATQGGFLTHILGYNRNPFSWWSAGVAVYQHIHGLLPQVAIAAAAVLCVLNPVAIRRTGWVRFLQARCGRPYQRAVLIAGLNAALTGISMLTIGKVGSSVNYYLGWDISISLLCGLLLFRLLATWKTPARIRGTVSPILAVLLVPAALVPSVALWQGLAPQPGYAVTARTDAELVRLLRKTPGPVLSENLLLPIQAGKAVEVEPATLSYIANAGRWDERRYVGLLDRHYFSLLVTYDIHAVGRFTPAVTAAIERAYVLEGTVGWYKIYRPSSTTAQTH